MGTIETATSRIGGIRTTAGSVSISATSSSVALSSNVAISRAPIKGYYDARGTQEYAVRGDYPQQRTYYQGQRCKSGTTAAILGAVAGGLLGREIGRGGEYNRPSTTGLILGAGGGALVGRAIGRSGNNCQ